MNAHELGQKLLNGPNIPVYFSKSQCDSEWNEWTDYDEIELVIVDSCQPDLSKPSIQAVILSQ